MLGAKVACSPSLNGQEDRCTQARQATQDRCASAQPWQGGAMDPATSHLHPPRKTLRQTPTGITQRMLYFLIVHLCSSGSTMTLGFWADAEASGPSPIFSLFFQPHHLTSLFHHKAETVFAPAILCPSHLSFVVLLNTGEGEGVRTGPSASPGQGSGGEEQGYELPADSKVPAMELCGHRD